MATDLIAAYWTVAGDVRPGGPTEISPWPIEARIEAAAAAGFAGIGLLHADLTAIEDHLSLESLRARIDAAGLRHVELEVMEGWCSDREPRAHLASARDDLLRAAELLGARHIKAIGEQRGAGWGPERTAEAFAGLCDAAAHAGASVVLEPMPFTDIPGLEAGLEIVERAGRANGKLLVDIWHVARGGAAWSDVAALPPGSVGHVELDDAAREACGTLFEDTINHRRYCGEGELDVAGFVAAVRALGYGGPFGVEVISQEVRGLPLGEAAARAYETTMRAVA